jgi:galactose mutarotase-like enzyme
MNTIDWHGYEGYILENEHLRVVIVPTLGAKIVSLVDKATNHEWLAPPTNPVRARAYGDTFTDHDLAGWDEMFPTIVACPSPREPSAMLPDHGEVWALPWDVNFVNERYLDTQVTGRAMPYELMRVAQLSDEGSLVLAYKLRNTGHASLFGLWAAHPLFNANQHTRIELPAQVTHVVNVVEHPVWGAPDRVLDYPVMSGIAQRLDRVGDAARKDYRKFYVPPEQPVASVALVQEDIGRSLRISWRGAVPRYLGVWVDEGTYSRGTTVALEPASGYYDSLKLAIKNQRSTVVLPGEVKTWWLQVQCGNA